MNQLQWGVGKRGLEFVKPRCTYCHKAIIKDELTGCWIHKETDLAPCDTQLTSYAHPTHLEGKA